MPSAANARTSHRHSATLAALPLTGALRSVLPALGGPATLHPQADAFGSMSAAWGTLAVPPALIHAVKLLDRVVRLHFLCFTHQLVLLGAASTTALAGGPAPATWQLLGIVAGGWLFHVFAYIFNDIMDLPVDRTQPSRAKDPLVRGDLGVGAALAIALSTIPAGALLTWALGGGLAAQWVLLACFAAMALYNVAGKKCFLPPLTDLIQGLSWGGLAFWGALTLGGTINAWTWVAGLSGILFILLINGVHGGLRDIENDFRTRSCTTAIFFGARPAPRGPESCSASMTRPLWIFASAVLAITVGVSCWSATLAEMPWPWLLLLALTNAASVLCLWRVFQVASPTWQRDFRVHLFVLLLPPVLAFLPQLEGRLLSWVVIAFFAPFLLFDVTWQVFGDLFRLLPLRPTLRRQQT
jgi:4-hydroxybenzoate polyprenyltransferase